MNNQIKELVRKYWRREVNKDEFVGLVKNEIGGRSQDFRFFFDSVIQNKNAEEVEILLVILYALESDDNMIELIHQLILEPWHREYEELAHDLQRRGSPESVPILKEAMQRKYRYLESYETGTRQFINQCGHALRSIGTEAAITAVRDLSKSSDPIVRDEMLYRLSRIEGRNDYQRTF